MMTKREIANLCCKVLAIYALMQGISQVFVHFDFRFLGDGQLIGTADVVQRVLWVTVPVLWIVMGAFVWRWSWLIAAWMVGYDIQDHAGEPDASPQSASAAEMQAIAFSVIGLWLLVGTLPRAVAYASQMIYMRMDSDIDMMAASNAFASATIAELFVRTVLGLWLLFGASGLVGLLRLVRGGKHDPPHNESSGNHTPPREG